MSHTTVKYDFLQGEIVRVLRKMPPPRAFITIEARDPNGNTVGKVSFMAEDADKLMKGQLVVLLRKKGEMTWQVDIDYNGRNKVVLRR